MTLQDILDHAIAGNAHADMPLIQAIDDYVQDPRNDREHKKLALRKLDDVMGASHPVDEDWALDDYLEITKVGMKVGHG